MSTNAADKPAEKRGLAAIPVALTVLATIFAGLSSSEMTRSMYFRSLAAQQQAKAASQWGFLPSEKNARHDARFPQRSQHALLREAV